MNIQTNKIIGVITIHSFEKDKIKVAEKQKNLLEKYNCDIYICEDENIKLNNVQYIDLTLYCTICDYLIEITKPKDVIIVTDWTRVDISFGNLLDIMAGLFNNDRTLVSINQPFFEETIYTFEDRYLFNQFINLYTQFNILLNEMGQTQSLKKI